MWSALAAGPAAGIRPQDVAMLGAPTWLEPGWTAPVLDAEGGSVRIHVAATDAEAAAWLSGILKARPDGVPPVFPLADTEAYGNGWSFVGFREGNVAGVVVRPSGAAADLAQRLVDAIEHDVPAPQPPVVEVNGQEVRVLGEWANVVVRPAPRLDPFTLLPKPIQVIPTGPGERFLGAEPDRLTVVVWDPFGRTAEVSWVR